MDYSFEKMIDDNIFNEILKIDRNKKLYDEYKNYSIKSLYKIVNDFDYFYENLENNIYKFYLSNEKTKCYFILIVINIIGMKLDEIDF